MIEKNTDFIIEESMFEIGSYGSNCAILSKFFNYTSLQFFSMIQPKK